MAVVAIDAAGTVVYANPQVERCFGWPPAELMGEPIERLVPERLWKAHAAHRRGFDALPSARPMGIGLTLVGRRRDGSEFPVEISLAPVMTADGPVVFASIVDITTRTSLEAQLLQATKLESVGRLAGGIAHDFANMLFAIRGHAAVIAENLDESLVTPDDDAMRRSAAAIDEAIERASALVRQLLAFSRRQVVQPAVVSPNPVIESLETLLTRLLGADTSVEYALRPVTGSFRIDPSQLDQVLINLVVNARDAMPDGGTVTIETADVTFDEPYAIEHFEVTPGPYVMIAVSDTGTGMDRETRRHIFEPFFTTKEAGRGNGLGLATVYGIVRQAGGHIWVYSEPGHGTTFKVYFPRVDDPTTTTPEKSAGFRAAAAPTARRPSVPGRRAATARAATARAATAGTARPRPAADATAVGPGAGSVLVVDDEPSMRELTSAILARGGFSVIAPGDPRAAVRLIEDDAVTLDALVTDLSLPGIPGRDVVARMLAHRPGTAVVILSGHRREAAGVDDLIARGAVFAAKPISAAALLGAVEEAIRRAAIG